MLGSHDARLRVLEATKLLDSPPEPAFDRFTRLAAEVCAAPVALVNLVDERRHFFKSALGLVEPWRSGRQAPLSHSFCQQVVAGRASLIVVDARDHALLHDSPAITALNMVAYAGIPLMVQGEAIGALCVTDSTRRPWTAQNLRLLEDLAAAAAAEIESRLALRTKESQRALTAAVLESMGDACMAIDAEGRFLFVNEAARRVFQAEPGQALPADWAALHRSSTPDGASMASSAGALVRGLQGDSTTGLTFTLQRPGAPTAIWVEASGRPVRDERGEVVAAVAVYRDVTTRRSELAEQRRNAQIYRAIVEHLPRGAVLTVDRDLRYVSAEGPLLPEILQRTDLTTLVGQRVEDVVLPANRDAVLDLYRRTFAGQIARAEVARDGHFFETSTVPVYDGDDIPQILVFTFDVTERRRETEALRDARDLLVLERALLESTLANIQDGVALLDERSTVLVCNEPFAELVGLSRDEVRGLPREKFLERLLPMLEESSPFQKDFERRFDVAVTHEYTFVRPRRRIMKRSWLPVALGHGGGFLVTWHDVTAERDLLAERERQLFVDALTGIPNRRAADRALLTEHERARRAGTRFSVAMFDVDHFKAVNDRHGHGAGDDVLRAVAATLSAEARLTDTVARWGGEEFIAVLGVPLDGAQSFCERARRAIAALAIPLVGGVTISVGVAEVAAGETIPDALLRADARLYDAKNGGRNRVAL